MKVHGTRAYIEPTPVPKMPAGLVELMEGLSREVLKNNPSEVYKFCAQHMRNLLVLRDGKPPVKYMTLEQKINKANYIIRRKAEERRRDFDKNMLLLDSTKEQSLGNDIEIASIVKNTDTLDISKEDSELREEKDEISLDNVENHSNRDTGTPIKDNEQKTTNENEVNKDNYTNEIGTNHHANDNLLMNNLVIVTSTDALDKSQLVQGNILDVSNDVKINVKQDINDDESDKPIFTNGEENDRNNIVQVASIDYEKDVNSELASTNINIIEVPNVKVRKVNEDDINLKEENQSKLNDDPQSVSEAVAEHNNILIAEEKNEQNDNISGDDIKDTIDITTNDSLNDSKSNNDEVKDNNLQENYNNQNQCSINDVIKADVTDTETEKEVDIIIVEKITKDTEKSQNPTNKTETLKIDAEINNLNTKENDTKTMITAKDNAFDNENNKHDGARNENKITDKTSHGMSNDNMTKVASVSEIQIDEITDFNTDVSEKNNGKIKEVSDVTKLINDHKGNDLILNIESEQQDQDNKNDTSSIHDKSHFFNKEPNEIQSKSSNVPETDKSKNSKPMDLETAAITIQKVFRNFLFRSKTSSFEEPSNIELNMFGGEPDTKDERDFTLRNQNKDRRVMGISRMDTVLQTVNEEKSLSLSTDESSTISSAATVIQAHIRGFLCRNRLNGNKVTSSTSLNTSKDSPVSSEVDPDLVKNKTVLNIHIVPEGGQFVSRDESIITSMELSLDGSPPASANLHPLGYDKSERRKQLKREDAIQSISPPSNNSRLSEEQDSVKEVIATEVENYKAEKSVTEMPVDSEHGVNQQEHIKDVLIADSKVEAVNNVDVMEPPDSQISITISNEDTLKNDLRENYSPDENLTDVDKQSKEKDIVKEVYVEENKTQVEKNISINISTDAQNILISNNDAPNVIGENETENNEDVQKSVKEVVNGKEETHQQLESEQKFDTQLNISTPHDNVQNKEKDKAATDISSDELDVVTPFTPTEEKVNDSDEPKLLHSGEFHDVVLPTKVSRNDTSVVSGE